MKVTIVMLGMVLVCRAEVDDSVVRFTNGDLLSGKLLSLSSDKLEWKSEILKDPAEFDLKHVLDLEMPAEVGNDQVENAEHQAILEMRNKDVIKGKLVGITDREITLDTAFAGRINVNKLMVRQVNIEAISDVLYRGPKSLEEWYQEEGETAWMFKAGALQSQRAGSISQEIDFTEECKIAFDASWRGGFRPRLIFFSEDHKSDSPSGGYELVFQGNTVLFKRAGSNNQWIGHTQNADPLRENEKVRIEIRASQKSGKVMFYLDGELMEIFEDANVKTLKTGKGFHIITQDNSPLRISNIVISEWDGVIDEVPKRRDNMRFQRFGGGRLQFDLQEDMGDAEEEKGEELEEGRMKLVNGDSIKGEVIGIEGETIKVKTELAEMSFPVRRLKNLLLAGLDKEDPKLYKGDVRATMFDGTKIVFRLDEVKDNKLIGFSQNFGNAEFGSDVFRRIEFNIHKPGLDDLRQKSDW